MITLSTSTGFAGNDEPPIDLPPIEVNDPGIGDPGLVDSPFPVTGTPPVNPGNDGVVDELEPEDGNMGCSTSDSVTREMIAGNRFRLMFSACLAGPRRFRCFTQYGAGTFWSYTWPDGSISTFQIINPVLSAPVIEVSCEE